MAKFWHLLPIFAMSTWVLYWLSLQAPAKPEDDGGDTLTFPSNLESLQAVARALQLYSARNWWYVFILFATAYMYKQAFSIPGSGILNILAGALYGQFLGTILVCIYTAAGASCTYVLSKTFLKETVRNLFPERFQKFETKIKQNRDRLFYYMAFIRIVPVSPGWAINLVSPLINVPYHIFFVTTLFGLIPYNFLGVSAGRMISSLESVHDIFTLNTFLTLILMALAALGPTFVLRRKEKSLTLKEG